MDKKDIYLDPKPIDKKSIYLDPTPIDKKSIYLDPTPIDKKDIYLDPAPIDKKDIYLDPAPYFLTCDGKKVATMEEVIAYNNMYYENMKIKKTDDFSQKSGMHR